MLYVWSNYSNGVSTEGMDEREGRVLLAPHLFSPEKTETNQFLLYSTLGMKKKKNSTGESQMNVYFSASERAFVHQ